jgi:hypothetical protein
LQVVGGRFGEFSTRRASPSSKLDERVFPEAEISLYNLPAFLHETGVGRFIQYFRIRRNYFARGVQGRKCHNRGPCRNAYRSENILSLPKMKIIASLAITTLTTLFAASTVQAHDDHGGKNKSKKHIIIQSCMPAPHCKPHYCPPTLVCTKEIDRCYHIKSGYDSHGCFFHYKVMVVTYASYYSNGTTRTFTRTFNV